MTSGVKREIAEIEDLKQKLLEYIQETPGGTFNGACAKYKVGYSTGFNWKRDDPDWAAQIEEARKLADEVGGDFAEGKLMGCIQNGEFPAIKYYLGTKHKNRGYVERSETETTMKYADITDDQLDEQINNKAGEAGVVVALGGEGPAETGE